MAKKCDYVICVNGGAKRSAPSYRYSYANTRGIVLSLSPKSATVSMSISSKKSAYEFGTRGCQLFDDLLYKVSLAWLLRYGRIVSIERVTVEVDGEDETTVFGVGGSGRACPPLPALAFDGKVSFPAELQSNRVMCEILSVARTRSSHRMAALSGFVLAKMKDGRPGASDIVERFSNLWTAMNGYYSFIGSRAGLGARDSEREKMGKCLSLHGMGDCTVMQKHQAQLARIAIQALEGVRGLPDDSPPEVRRKLASLSPTIRAFTAADGTRPYQGMTLEGYLLLCLPYYFRCELLHGTKPLPLFVYGTDERVWCLPLLSDVIEQFLDENLWKLFDIDELDAIDQKLRLL